MAPTGYREDGDCGAESHVSNMARRRGLRLLTITRVPTEDPQVSKLDTLRLHSGRLLAKLAAVAVEASLAMEFPAFVALGEFVAFISAAVVASAIVVAIAKPSAVVVVAIVESAAIVGAYPAV